ncbi:hypothetical protein XA68_18008 [Ophiocordyceps unilateralis]|uniref:Inner kinetochore subunit AME1 domain-containing protein n=1 Tax=Ophiocordyceps unilateralis TaxID=268505 RepID=A0A2A9PJW0_OPHUN|nr:hypothetical protein XA68_18008 [Ophiocordyceps unilateralis]
MAAAAGRERRAERLNERLRGAQRINIDDESFNLNIDGLATQPVVASPAQRSAKASDRKRKRHSKEAPDTVKDKGAARRSDTTDGHARGSSIPAKSARRNGTSSAMDDLPASHQAPRGANGLEALDALPRMLSPTRPRLADAMIEEVAESPLHAPGSGQRRKVPLAATGNSTAEMQGILSTDATAPPSSPLARKVRRGDVAATPMRKSTPRHPRSDEPDELSPEHRRDATADQEKPSILAVDPSLVLPQAHDEAEASAEEAEEMDAVQAARTLGMNSKGRGARSSPELGSGPPEAEAEEPPLQTIRIQKRPGKSPAKQRQPASRPRTLKGPSRDERRPKQKLSASDDKPVSKRLPEKKDGEDDGVEITVQRFVNHKKRGGEADDADPLQDEMVFVNRSGESVVDVFAQVCEEVMASTLAQFQQLVETADGAAKKKECRIKMRAVEAYREELRSRLLQHAIHLNHWHTLRKQVRQAQKEKLTLREEIIRLNSEREQVALRMDAVRIKHEADSKESTRRINTSALMHDMDLAVEQGRDAPELPRQVQQLADAANLELLIAQVSDTASSGSSTGGLLHQLREFNAFLERAALALESR